MAIEHSKAEQLIERWIERDPWQPAAADAYLRRYHVHIWALIGHLPAANNDAASVAGDYQVPVEAVQAALAYYAQHRGAIDAKLEANAAYGSPPAAAAAPLESTQAGEFINRWIELDPLRPGSAYARLRDYGVHVWALIGHLPAVKNDAGLVAEDYQIPVEAVEAALAYYAQHREAIDAKLEANAAYVNRPPTAD